MLATTTLLNENKTKISKTKYPKQNIQNKEYQIYIKDKKTKDKRQNNRNKQITKTNRLK